jgi:hypothetical protein
MTSAEAMPNALREYDTPLKPSSLDTRDDSRASESSRNESPAFADDVPVVDVGGVRVNTIRDDVTRLTGGGEVK